MHLAGYAAPPPLAKPLILPLLDARTLNIDCSVLMGANIAAGIAAKEFSEAVIGRLKHWVTVSARLDRAR